MITLLRIVSLIEGLSFLYLLFCSIYLKRVLGNEHAIDTPGMVHGVLFVAFCVALGLCWQTDRLSFRRCVGIFVASVIPFGFLWIDHTLKKK